MPAKCAAPRATAHLSQEYRTPAWEQRKLGELCSFSKGCGYSKNDLRDQGTPIILYGRLYTNYETQIHSVDTFVKPLENSVYSEGGEVIIPASGETAEDISIASVVEKPGIILGGDLNVITSSADIDPVFLALELSYGKPHFDLAKRAQGKSVVHIHNEDIANVFFGHPNIAEQRRIGAFFDRLDSLITLHQRKYDKLCVLKKSMLDKMFPKGGSLYPEIRFAGFTDPWEQRKLSSTCEQLSRTINPLETPNEEFTEYSMPAFDNNETAETVIGNSMNSLRKIVDRPCLLVNKLNVRKKRIWHVPRPEANAVCSSEFVPFSSHSSDLSFIKISLLSERITAYLESCSSGSSNSQKRVTPEIIMSSEIIAPSLAEQRRIGAFFDHLDSLITLHQRKLELLRNIKKSMLDKMFV